MPFYEYECRSCGEEMAVLVRAPAEELPACGACGSVRLRRLVSACHVRGTRSADPGALREPRTWLERPERFGEAMRAVEERTNVKLDSRSVERAVERLKAGRDG